MGIVSNSINIVGFSCWFAVLLAFAAEEVEENALRTSCFRAADADDRCSMAGQHRIWDYSCSIATRVACVMLLP